jgi:hypothetical protein
MIACHTRLAQPHCRVDERSLGREMDVEVVRDDGGALPSELKSARSEGLGAGDADFTPDAGGTGEED